MDQVEASLRARVLLLEASSLIARAEVLLGKTPAEAPAMERIAVVLERLVAIHEAWNSDGLPPRRDAYVDL